MNAKKSEYDALAKVLDSQNLITSQRVEAALKNAGADPQKYEITGFGGGNEKLAIREKPKTKAEAKKN